MNALCGTRVTDRRAVRPNSCSYCPAIRSSSNYGLSNTRPGSRSCTVLLAAASRSHRWVTNLGYLRAVALWKQYRPAGVALALSVSLEPMFNFCARSHGIRFARHFTAYLDTPSGGCLARSRRQWTRTAT